MKIKIYSRRKIEKAAELPFPPHTALISITDPDDSDVRLKFRPERLLRLKFDDITPEIAAERLELTEEAKRSEEALASFLEGYNTYLFTDAMAEETAEFIKNSIKKTALFICQCEYGQSRSAAVAAAILEHYFGKGDIVFNDDRYCPNSLVYPKLMTALSKQSNIVQPKDNI